MKDAIASVEIYTRRGSDPVQRLSLVVGAPAPVSRGEAERHAETKRLAVEDRSDSDSPGPAPEMHWACRVALANRCPAETIVGPDSIAVLAGALARSRKWLSDLEDEGSSLFRDRACSVPFRFE